MIDAEIFKAYDIRGLYGEQIDEDVAYRLGRAFARVLADGEGRPATELRVGLARDMRLEAPAMAARYADGIRDEGADVLDIGEVGDGDALLRRRVARPRRRADVHRIAQPASAWTGREARESRRGRAVR